MSEEEKKAIEKSKLSLEIAKDNSMRNVFYDISSLEILLNIIDKQQKEIEELMKICDSYKSASNHCAEIFSDTINPNYISKDKIIEWLDRFDIEEDLQNEYDELLGSEAISKFLKKLLKENTNVCDSYKSASNHCAEIFSDTINPNYISKDKIKAKIEEYHEKYNNYPNYTPEDFEFRQEYLHKFRVLEELLEENNEKSDSL